VERGWKNVEEIGGASSTRQRQALGINGHAAIRHEVGERTKLRRTDLCLNQIRLDEGVKRVVARAEVIPLQATDITIGGVVDSCRESKRRRGRLRLGLTILRRK
jgi:hypothetical protein